jgi:hypothetical protein
MKSRECRVEVTLAVGVVHLCGTCRYIAVAKRKDIRLIQNLAMFGQALDLQHK